MSGMTDEMAHARFWRRNLPAGTSAPGGAEWTDVSSSTAFGPFTAGAFVVIACDGAVHVNAGGEDDSATTSNPQLASGGERDFTLPAGATYVHVIGAESDTNAAVWEA